MINSIVCGFVTPRFTQIGVINVEMTNRNSFTLLGTTQVQYFLPMMLLFLCTLLLTVVGLLCIVLLSCVYLCYLMCIFFYRCTVHFEINVVHSPTNALFIKLVKSFKFTLKYTIISLLHVSVFNDHH